MEDEEIFIYPSDNGVQQQIETCSEKHDEDRCMCDTFTNQQLWQSRNRGFKFSNDKDPQTFCMPAWVVLHKN